MKTIQTLAQIFKETDQKKGKKKEENLKILGRGKKCQKKQDIKIKKENQKKLNL